MAGALTSPDTLPTTLMAVEATGAPGARTRNTPPGAAREGEETVGGMAGKKEKKSRNQRTFPKKQWLPKEITLF